MSMQYDILRAIFEGVISNTGCMSQFPEENDSAVVCENISLFVND